jgi:multidrug efflux pump subunit AcrB
MRRAALAGLAAGLVLAACDSGKPRPGEVVVVQVAMTGVSPQEIEAGVIGRLEQALGAMPGVLGMRSVAGHGLGTVEVRLRAGVDAMTATSRARDAVAAVLPQLPASAPPPTISRARAATWVYATVEDRPGAAESVMHRVQAVPGVIAFDRCGVREAVVSVELVPLALLSRNLSPDDVLRAVTAQDVAVPGGRLDHDGRGHTIRVRGALESFDAVSTMPLDERGTRLRDVSAITERSETDCVVVGTQGRALVRAGLHAPRDAKVVSKALADAGATVIPGPVHLRDVELAGAVHERATQAQALIDAGGEGWYAVVPRAGQRVQLVVAGDDPWRGAPALQAVLRGDDLEQLVVHARAGLDALRASPMVAAAEQRGAGRAPELRLQPDRQRAADLGVDVAAIAAALRLAHGERAGTYVQDNRRRVDVVVTVDGGPERWMTLPVRARDGGLIRLEQVIEATEALVPSEILRIDRRRAVVLWAQARAGTSEAALRQVLAAALPDATIGRVEPHHVADGHW